jgi:hypothetical protein
MALMKDPVLQLLWNRGFGNEEGRLFQGIHEIPETNTCFIVELPNIPKEEKERIGLTVGGDRQDYSGDVATSTSDITTFKILINIILSTKDADMMMIDINKYYLGTPLPRYE